MEEAVRKKIGIIAGDPKRVRHSPEGLTATNSISVAAPGLA